MSRPIFQDGYPGAKACMSDEGISLGNYKDADITVNDNYLKIKLNCKESVKMTTQLHHYQGNIKTPVKDSVFVQRKDKNDDLKIKVCFAQNGYYALEIYAKKATKPGDSLPNVYNYIINVRNNNKPAVPFAKAYTKYDTDKDYVQPNYIDPKQDLSNLKWKFYDSIKKAVKVAVHCGEEWFHFEKKGGGWWEGRTNLEKYKGRNTKVTLNVCESEESNSYSVLLDYWI